MKALGTNILITPVKEEKKSVLLLTTGAVHKYYKVLSVGSKVHEVVDLKEGDEIFIQNYGACAVDEEKEILSLDAKYVVASR